MATSRYLRDETGKEDPYIFNNAVNEERKRVDEQSVALNELMLRKPIHAPIKSPKKVLEIGYGTGLMCHLLGQMFPEATIYGVDPSPPAAGFHDQLNNVVFIQGKYEDLLQGNDHRFELASFDYVFVRMSVCWVTDWPAHVKRIKSLLKPNGWVELQDVSLCRHFKGLDPDPVDDDWLWARAVRELCLRNIDWASGMNLERRMNEAGLRDVQSTEYWFALCNPVAGKAETQSIAEYTAKYVPNVIYGLLDQYARDEYSALEIEEMKGTAAANAYSGKINDIHWKFHVCIGRKAA